MGPSVGQRGPTTPPDDFDAPRAQTSGSTAPPRPDPALSSTPGGVDLTPGAWCRRVLASLTTRRLEVRKTQQLELLLRYFIGLDPAIEAFDALLAQHGADPRPATAQMAQRLEDAWLRTRIGAVQLPQLPLQETLRTLGALLDEYDAEAGFVAVVGGSSKVQPFGEWKPRALEPLELLHEIAARTALRGHIRHADPLDPRRYETRLRAVGAELDEQPPQAYQLLVSRQTIVVEGTAGCYRLWTTETLSPRLQTLITQRQDDPPDASPPPRDDVLLTD